MSKSKKAKSEKKKDKGFPKTKEEAGRIAETRIRLHGSSIQVGDFVNMNFQRTLRIPDNDKVYPLPAGMGDFPLYEVSAYKDKVPQHWLEAPGTSYFLPMYQREAMWISFGGSEYFHPSAVKVGVGNVCALTGEIWDDDLDVRSKLSAKEQNYLVVPTQPWLDGINSGKSTIRQFVAMPLGMGYTVEGQVTGSEDFGGLQITVYPAKPGKFPEQEERMRGIFRGGNAPDGSPPFYGGIVAAAASSFSMTESVEGAEMGLAGGGTMHQDIYPDEHGINTWDQSNPSIINIFIVNSQAFRDITGLEPPTTPISARTYTQNGYPWFDLYDDHLGDIPKSEILENVKSVKQMDQEKGFGPLQDDSTVNVPHNQVVVYKNWPIEKTK